MQEFSIRVQKKYEDYVKLCPHPDSLYTLSIELEDAMYRNPKAYAQTTRDDAMYCLLYALVNIWAKPLEEHLRIAEEHTKEQPK
jgi:hypothetical protein